jgi:hypothetical protein
MALFASELEYRHGEAKISLLANKYFPCRTPLAASRQGLVSLAEYWTTLHAVNLTGAVSRQKRRGRF